jgi:hypothetical protein
MDISGLLENVIEEKIVFRGNEIVVGIMPDAYTLEDSNNVDRNSTDSIVEYIAKGLKHWNLDWKGGDFPPSVENLKSRVPEALLLALMDRIESLKQAAVGKQKAK